MIARDTAILVIGGAGHVRSHVALALSDRGFRSVVYDDLSGGHAAFVTLGPLERGDVRDTSRLEDAIRRHRPVAIVNLAAEIKGGRSGGEPDAFYSSIVGGAISVIEAARSRASEPSSCRRSVRSTARCSPCRSARITLATSPALMAALS